MCALPKFQFHPRCKEIKLTHLCFADAFILCSKGDYQSILLILQAFKLFSNSAGLKENQQNSSVYCHGMPEIDVQRVVDVYGFSRSSLPFKYLGVPIYSKKIIVAQCGHLVDKIITRIKIWSSRNLSYTARMQLINSVLLSLHMYWAQIYVIPKSVLQDIVKLICRAFLWSGQTFSQKPSNIAWDKICCAKQNGGLGFRDVVVEYCIHGEERLKQCFTLAELENMAHYSVKQVYEKLVGVKPRVHWDRLVWNRLITPKHKFICWLAVQCRLQTTTKLARIGISKSALYLICGLQDEDHNHLFFQCQFSNQIIQAVQQWLGSSMNGSLH
ncbi:uncharacterized protein [Spinacia oleracea]|uniref:Reverse transcriptase zinc-binding domain-containing protein n=1 Tax=Spinacia oleracea TaxID=3562 RepID=A0ABM3QQT3_SPIOL|nr:uncharacterized protein LOC110804898 [Spinacia oleracea]